MLNIADGSVAKCLSRPALKGAGERLTDVGSVLMMGPRDG